MVSAFIEHRLSSIHYRHYGHGPLRIVALHGYGESSDSFLFLEKYLEGKYCVIALDLPFHGLTNWRENHPFNSADLILILSGIFNSMGLHDDKFILIGYSLGGRLALSIMQDLPQKITRILLLAPDGMKVNFWYWLATQTWVGNRLFLSTMKNPSYFFALLRFLNRFGLINKSIYKFMFIYIDDEKVRSELYHRWTCLRTFKPDLKIVRHIIREQKIAMRMLYGKYDRIILSKRARQFYKGLEPYCQLHIIDAGHDILKKKHADVIITLLTT